MRHQIQENTSKIQIAIYIKSLQIRENLTRISVKTCEHSGQQLKIVSADIQSHAYSPAH